MTRVRYAIVAALAGLAVPQAAEAGRKVCVWYDVRTPVASAADEKCSPAVLPDALNDHVQPYDCTVIPPLATSVCVGARVWLP